MAGEENRMKLSDYVAEKLVEVGIRHVFMVTGGGAMHLNHSFGTNKNLDCIFNHHEQACAIAAESYYRLNNELAVANVTSGPGGTNAITGVYGAFVDSIGMLIISGQVKIETTVRSTGLPLRQYGDQELDIEELVRPITKYCVMVTDPKTIRYHLEKAIYLAKSGRPGPCWLDIPLDVQSAQIDPATQIGFDPSEAEEGWNRDDLDQVSREILEKIKNAKRPVIYAGSGIRASGEYKSFLAMVEKLGIPVVTAWNVHDAIWDTHPYYAGRPGTVGDRSGNFVTQNADLLLILGSRLNIRLVSYNWKSFAREAYKIWVDIDEVELKKPTVIPDMPVHADLKVLLPKLATANYSGPTESHNEWMKWAKERIARYPAVLPEYWENELINPYCFAQTLFESFDDDQIVIAGNATASVAGYQAAKIKKGQRLWTNSGSATMGYDLPAAIGAYKASGGNDIVCLTGDGSIMMNLQELQTIAGNQYPIKIFILNNSGYVSIFQTHRNFFNGVEVGGGPTSGVNFPNFEKLSMAFDMPYIRCENHEGMQYAIRKTLDEKGPAVCEVMIDKNVKFAPKLGAKVLPDGKIVSPPLEDLSPFLSREELASNMIIPMQEF
jgi:acetolactate synthase-1/2/3 large subunit